MHPIFVYCTVKNLMVSGVSVQNCNTVISQCSARYRDGEDIKRRSPPVRERAKREPVKRKALEAFTPQQGGFIVNEETTTNEILCVWDGD